MPSPYIQLLLVNMLLAALVSTTVLGAPILPAVAGALAAGALLYVRSKAKRGRETSRVGIDEAAGTRDRAPSVGRRATESETTPPTPTGVLHEAGTGA